MQESPDARLPEETDLHRFLDRALLLLEAGSLVVVLAITLAQPSTGRLGIPSWALVLAFTVLFVAFEVLRNRVRSLHAFRLKFALDLPAIAVLYALGAEPGGPIFVFFFVSVICSSAALTLRESVVYTAAAAVLVAFVELVAIPNVDPQGLAGRLVLLAVFGASTAIQARRISLEQASARSAHGRTGRLEELDRLRENFVSSISHDLRTPLTAARAGLGLLQESAAGRLRSDERDLLENARRNAARLGMIVDDLLAYNQLAADTLRLELEPLDLRAVVSDAVSTVRPLLREKGQALELDLPEALPAEGDPRRLNQVVVNLLENANVHTPEGTRVSVSGRVADGEVSLVFSDDGPGLPKTETEAIFRRFYRLGTEEGGSGLGLAIARGIVELHGGRIRAENRPQGGASFVVVLPRRGGGDAP